MRIVFVDTTIAGNLIGGAQTFLPGLFSGLQRKGHDVHLITNGSPNPKLISDLEQSGIEIHPELFEDGELVDDIVPRVAKWLTELGMDLFVVSTSPDLGWVVLPRITGTVGTITIAHSNEDTYYKPLTHYSRFVTRAIGVSDEICTNFQEYCGVQSEKIDWIPYGITPSLVEPQRISQSEREPIRLVYVGRLYEEQKRVSDLSRIVSELGRSGLDYSFRIIGEGPMMANMQSQMAQEVSKGRVSFLGWLGNTELLENLRNCEVSLLVSDSEGFPIALVEAMANGCVPIVTDIKSGTEQLIQDGINGFIVPIGDISAFADRIKSLASDRDRLLEMRIAAWNTGRQYSIDRMVDNYVSCFEQAVQDARENPRVPDPDFPLMPSCRSPYPLWLRRIKARIVGARR